MDKRDALRSRIAPLEMTSTEFRKAGHQLVERIAEFLSTLPDRPVTVNESPRVIREILGSGPLPEKGAGAKNLLEEAADLLFDHSTFNGHPRFWGVITSSAAPIGALGDLLAASVNPNMGGWIGGPMANEIEAQTIRWIAELIGYPTDCGGLLVRGGNMGNFVGLLAARRVKAPWDVRATGLLGEGARRLRLYTSGETHTWIQKAADMFGLGTEAIRWIPVDTHLRMATSALREQIQADIEAGDLPFLVIGTAGTVSTGAVDPLPEMAAICRQYDLWFHVDAAYGGFAAVLLKDGKGMVPGGLKGISEADSVAVDPHKWLYTPLEAGCALVRNSLALRGTFSYHPPYYHFVEQAEATVDYHEYGPQNSRGFRALKVWLALRQVGRAGYVEMISDDILLAQELYRLVDSHPELQAFTQGLSITTFRYVPPDLTPGSQQIEAYLNQLNAELLTQLQQSGEAFLSNAVVRGIFLLRACVVNFRTSLEDIEALPVIVSTGGVARGLQTVPESPMRKGSIISSRFRSWWQEIQVHPMRSAAMVAVGGLGIALIVALLGGYFLHWDWTGFGPYTPPVKDSTFQRGKTLWDWLQLLLVPILLAVGGFWLNQIQKSREEKATEHRARIEREAAEKHAQTEREVALDNQREAALQAYIDKMSDLLLENKLRESPKAEAKEVANARTFTVLPRLDALRKRSVEPILIKPI